MEHEEVDPNWIREIQRQMDEQARRPASEAEARERFASSLIGYWSNSEGSYAPMDIQVVFKSDGTGSIDEPIPGGCFEFLWRPKSTGLVQVTDIEGEPLWADFRFDLVFRDGKFLGANMECDHPGTDEFFLANGPLAFRGVFDA